MVDDVHPSRAVYSTLFGGYESLNEAHVQQPGVDMICFTDDAALTSEVWEVVVVDPAFPLDTVRSQRLIKILGHERLRGYTETLYVDNSVTLKVPATELIGEWLADADIAIPLHSYRDTVADEFAAVVRHSLDELPRIIEQFDHYALSGIPIDRLKPYWTGLIARRPNPEIEAACREWALHVMRYSRRDQLSCRASGFGEDGPKVHEIAVDNFSSDFHLWPEDVGRQLDKRASSAVMRVPDDLKRRQLEQELAKAEEARDHQAAMNAELQRQVLELSLRHETLWSALRRRIPTRLRRSVNRLVPMRK